MHTRKLLLSGVLVFYLLCVRLQPFSSAICVTLVHAMQLGAFIVRRIVTGGALVAYRPRSYLLAAELLSTTRPLRTSQLLSCDCRDLRSESTISVVICSPIVCLLLFSQFLPSVSWLCLVGIFGLIGHLLHSPLACTADSSNNNKNVY